MKKYKKQKFFLMVFVALGVLLVCGGFTSYKAVKKHHVIYDLDGGMISSEFARYASWIDELETPTAEKEHYVFKGWTDATGEFVETIKKTTDDIVLKANYSPEVYTVTFKGGDNVVSRTNYAYGTEISNLNLFAKEFSKTHPYEDFDGWYDSEGNKFTKITKTDFGNKTLSAKFKGKRYSITYELNDGTANDLPDGYTYGVGIDSFPDASKNGMTFDGWYSDENLTEQVASISADSHDDVHLYAKYSELPVTTTRTYTRNFGSTSNSGNVSVSYDLSTGAHISAINYHVSRAVEDGGQEEINAEDCGIYLVNNYGHNGYWICEDGSTITDEEYDAKPYEERKIINRVSHVDHYVVCYYDHAYQGLSQLPYRISTGTKFYLNGVSYTYSGEWGSGTQWEYDHATAHDLIIFTCTPAGDGQDYFVYFDKD